jgi:hypothetical protein
MNNSRVCESITASCLIFGGFHKLDVFEARRFENTFLFSDFLFDKQLTASDLTISPSLILLTTEDLVKANIRISPFDLKRKILFSEESHISGLK